MRRVRVKAMVLATISLLFIWLFYTRYWIWRDCIAASQSSCRTPDGSNVTEGGLVWGIVALGFLAGALIAQFKQQR